METIINTFSYMKALIGPIIAMAMLGLIIGGFNGALQLLGVFIFFVFSFLTLIGIYNLCIKYFIKEKNIQNFKFWYWSVVIGVIFIIYAIYFNDGECPTGVYWDYVCGK